MARTKTITYECEQCGTDIIVTSTGEGQLSPIYCCGVRVTETTTKKSAATSGKKAGGTKAPVRKMGAKKGSTAKKKASKK